MTRLNFKLLSSKEGLKLTENRFFLCKKKKEKKRLCSEPGELIV